MKIEYRREISQTYMLVSETDCFEPEDYRIRMLEENEIAGFLPCRVQFWNRESLFSYQVTSRQPLTKAFASGGINKSFLQLLCSSIAEALESLEDYLLDSSSLALQPGMIFTNAEKTEIRFCCLPVREEAVKEDLKELGEFILPRLDHEDQEAVVLGYAFYQKCCDENFSPGLFYDLLKDGSSRNLPPAESIMTEDEKEEEMKAAFFPEPEKNKERVRQKREKQRERQREKEKEDSKKQNREKRSWREILRKILAFCTKDISFPERKKWGRGTEKKGKKKPESIETESWNCLENNFRKKESGEIEARELDDSAETAILGQGLPAEGDAEKMERARAWLEPETREGEAHCDRYPLIKDHYVVGKSRTAADIRLSSEAVSRVHACLKWNGAAYLLEDINSRNGSRWNEELCQAGQEYPLSDGDRLTFADLVFLGLSSKVCKFFLFLHLQLSTI